MRIKLPHCPFVFENFIDKIFTIYFKADMPVIMWIKLPHCPFMFENFIGKIFT